MGKEALDITAEIKNSKHAFLGLEPVGKLLVKLSIPAMVGLVVYALYNLVDTIYIGQGFQPIAGYNYGAKMYKR